MKYIDKTVDDSCLLVKFKQISVWTKATPGVAFVLSPR
jgi:hypothetical protein